MKLRTIKAFTLMEMLLGMAIFSIVALCVYRTFATGIAINERSQGQGTLAREMRWSFNTLTSELSAMVPFDFSNSYPEKFSFTGQKDRLTFLVKTPEGLKVISYYLSSTQEGSIHTTIIGKTTKKNVTISNVESKEERYTSLIRKERSWIDFVSGDLDSDADFEVLAAHVKEEGLKFIYGVKENEEGDAVSWKNEWKDNEIPLYVRIEVQFLDTGNNNNSLAVTRDVYIPGAQVKAKVESPS